MVQGSRGERCRVEWHGVELQKMQWPRVDFCGVVQGRVQWHSAEEWCKVEWNRVHWRRVEAYYKVAWSVALDASSAKVPWW